jgi:hypothetical protein
MFSILSIGIFTAPYERLTIINSSRKGMRIKYALLTRFILQR